MLPAPRSLLLFDLDDAHFGLDATLVRESVWLPELTPVEEMPSYIVGMFNLRGLFIPVADLNLRFGHPAKTYRPSDQVVVLELDQLLMGLIVNEVREVVELSADTVQPPPKFDTEMLRHDRLVSGEVRVNDDIVTLLDARQLMQLPQQDEQTVTAHAANYFNLQAMPGEQAVYRARAKALMENTAEEEVAHLSLAVVELDGEYFGIELEAVQEFCDIAHFGTIPCCPPHILGAMSLRGNLFTLLDVRAALNLTHTSPCGGKAVVTRALMRLDTGMTEQVVGVVVNEVHDVVYLRQEELQAAPAQLREQRGTEIKGTASYAGKMMLVLDLPALLAREEWIVNESV